MVVENVRQRNYFSEKLIDALLTRTVPVYWGCPNIGDYFDSAGFVLIGADGGAESGGADGEAKGAADRWEEEGELTAEERKAREAEKVAAVKAAADEVVAALNRLGTERAQGNAGWEARATAAAARDEGDSRGVARGRVCAAPPLHRSRCAPASDRRVAPRCLRLRLWCGATLCSRMALQSTNQCSPAAECPLPLLARAVSPPPSPRAALWLSARPTAHGASDRIN